MSMIIEVCIMYLAPKQATPNQVMGGARIQSRLFNLNPFF